MISCQMIDKIFNTVRFSLAKSGREFVISCLVFMSLDMQIYDFGIGWTRDTPAGMVLTLQSVKSRLAGDQLLLPCNSCLIIARMAFVI